MFRFFKFQGLGSRDEWFAAAQKYFIDRPEESVLKIHNLIDVCSMDELSLCHQFEILSAIPNYHHWGSSSNSGVKMHQYFVPMGKSPRNLILGELEKMLHSEEHFIFLKNVMKHIISRRYIVQVPKVKTRKVRLVNKRNNIIL